MIINYTGLHKSPPDPRDVLMESFLEPVRVTLPPTFDLTDNMTPVKSQGQEGACVGFAMVTGVKEFQEQRERKKFTELSPRFLYEAAKKISGHSEGTTLRAACDVALKLGVCEEKYWPYVAREPGTPKLEALPNALRYRIKTYARITNLDTLKRSILDPKIGASIIGVYVYKGMISDEAKTTGVVTNPTCFQSSIGGHALCAIGYNDKSPYFKNDGHVKVKNSWGPAYGDEGYLYLSYKYINKNMIDSFSSVDIVENENYYKRVLAHLPKRKGLWV